MEIPLGKNFALLTRNYIGIITHNLSDLEIERYFYPIVLIGESEKVLCQNDLSELMAVDKATIVRVVDYLSEKGLIERVRNLEDRRFYHLKLTKQGNKYFPQIKSAFEKANEVCFLGFDETEKDEFKRLLLKMHQNLEAHPRQEVKLNYNKLR